MDLIDGVMILAPALCYAVSRVLYDRRSPWAMVPMVPATIILSEFLHRHGWPQWRW